MIMLSFPPKQILVPTDFSECAAHAMAQAFALAKAVGAKVHLLNAYDLYTYGMGPVMADRVLDELVHAHKRQLAAAAEPYKDSGALGQVLLKSGDPRDVIVQTAHELNVDLIVMGTAGRQGLRRFMIGKVTEAVLRSAGCPVMAVREPSAEPGARSA
jgi:nucleotide-binding universal stress UspA family protein